jgi:isopentenyldiphosphate isomerase
MLVVESARDIREKWHFNTDAVVVGLPGHQNSCGGSRVEETFDVVNEENRVVGRATRSQVHGNPSLLHRAAHVLVVNAAGEIFLQRRSRAKTVQPRKWDSSVGGHVNAGESYEAAAGREMEEELGIVGASLEFLYTYIHRNAYESEYVATFRTSWEGPFQLHPEEIDDGRFWSFDEIDRRSREGIFTPNFLEELSRYRAWLVASGD